MTKLEIEAIKALPEECCVDGLCCCTMNGYVVAMAPNLPPVIFKDGLWRELNSKYSPPEQREGMKTESTWLIFAAAEKY